MSERKPGSIPTLHVTGANLPEAWEAAVLAVYDNGVEVSTEYDKPGDLPSLDASVVVEVTDPLSEPRIHKNFPGGPAELEVYRQEVVDGIHDHWIKPKEGKWTYTYHQRLFAYRPLIDVMHAEDSPEFPTVNQMNYIIEKLSQVPYSRRAQAITWIPNCDPATDDPPCLQRIWCRMLPDGAGGYTFNMNTHWRSRDLYKAWFMNVFAITDLMARMAAQLQGKMGVQVACGRYVDMVDSLHIYGSYRDEDFEAEVAKMRATPYTDRAWDSETLDFMFEEARRNLAEDPDYYAGGKQ